MLSDLICFRSSQRLLDDILPGRQGAALRTRREYRMGALTCPSQASLNLHPWVSSRVIGAPGEEHVQPYLAWYPPRLCPSGHGPANCFGGTRDCDCIAPSLCQMLCYTRSWNTCVPLLYFCSKQHRPGRSYGSWHQSSTHKASMT